MDPNACLQRWRNAILDGDNDGAFEAAVDLRHWLCGGGFDPEWKDTPEEARLREWCAK